MKDNEEKACLCALNRIFGFEPKIALAMMTHLGSASEVFSLKTEDIDRILGPYSRYKGKIGRKVVDECHAELEKLSRSGTSFIGWSERCYPALLKECADAPIGLYVRSSSSPERLWDQFRRRIAIIGTRDLSPYGRDWCEKIVDGISRCKEKPVIVSGLAYGADICAHKAAISSGLETIGVMATGPDMIYPYRHKGTAELMATSEGCALITDYPPGTAPRAIHFLRRNRIIAGLCEATILIESKAKGGGMMTAGLAASYNRDVYAIPGRLDDLRSQGCNILIRAKTAEPVISVEDLVESLGFQQTGPASHGHDSRYLEGLYQERFDKDRIEKMAILLLEIRKNRGISVEDLAETVGMDYTGVSRLTGILEADGLIQIDLLQRCRIANISR